MKSIEDNIVDIYAPNSDTKRIYGTIIDNGNKDVDKPVTDMRDIDSYKWELQLDKIKREVKYVETNEQAVKWLSGEYNTGFQSHDLRSRIKDKFSQSEYEKLVNKFNIE